MSINEFELNIVAAVQEGGSSFWDGFFRVITHLGSWYAVAAIAVLVAFCFGWRNAARYGFIVGLGAVWGWIIKIIVARPRPAVFAETIGNTAVTAKIAAGGSSFPSGHTLAVVLTVICLMYFIFNKWKPRPWIKAAVICALALPVLLVGFSRIYLGVHYVGDALAAIVFGIGFYYLFASIITLLSRFRAG